MRRMNLTDTQVATSETAQDINRSIVLNLIREPMGVLSSSRKNKCPALLRGVIVMSLKV